MGKNNISSLQELAAEVLVKQNPTGPFQNSTLTQMADYPEHIQNLIANAEMNELYNLRKLQLLIDNVNEKEIEGINNSQTEIHYDEEFQRRTGSIRMLYWFNKDNIITQDFQIFLDELKNSKLQLIKMLKNQIVKRKEKTENFNEIMTLLENLHNDAFHRIQFMKAKEKENKEKIKHALATHNRVFGTKHVLSDRDGRENCISSVKIRKLIEYFTKLEKEIKKEINIIRNENRSFFSVFAAKGIKKRKQSKKSSRKPSKKSSRKPSRKPTRK